MIEPAILDLGRGLWLIFFRCAHAYQIRMRSWAGRYMASPGAVPNAW
jgi:hypothetical protein